MHVYTYSHMCVHAGTTSPYNSTIAINVGNVDVFGFLSYFFSYLYSYEKRGIENSDVLQIIGLKRKYCILYFILLHNVN